MEPLQTGPRRSETQAEALQDFPPGHGFKHGERRLRAMHTQHERLASELSSGDLYLDLTFLAVAHADAVRFSGTKFERADYVALELPPGAVNAFTNGAQCGPAVEDNLFWRLTLTHFSQNPPRYGVQGVNAQRPLRAARMRLGALMGQRLFNGEGRFVLADAEKAKICLWPPLAIEREIPLDDFYQTLGRFGQKDDFLKFGTAFLPSGSGLIQEEERRAARLAVFTFPDSSVLNFLFTRLPPHCRELSAEMGVREGEVLLAAYDTFVQGALCLYNEVDQLTNLFHGLARRLQLSPPSRGDKLAAVHIGGAGHCSMLLGLLNALPQSERLKVFEDHDSRHPVRGKESFCSPFFLVHAQALLDALSFQNDELKIAGTALEKLFLLFLEEDRHCVEKSIWGAALRAFPHEFSGIDLTSDAPALYRDEASAAAARANCEELYRNFDMAFIFFWLTLEGTLVANTPLGVLKEAVHFRNDSLRRGKYLGAWQAITAVSDEAVLDAILGRIPYVADREYLRRFGRKKALWEKAALPSPFEAPEARDIALWREFLLDRELIVS